MNATLERPAPALGNATARAAITIRPAAALDQPCIRELVKRERLNPLGIDWPRFIVATGDDGRIVGAVQLRRHPDGSRELGSLVVAPQARGAGIAGRMIDRLLGSCLDPVHMITSAQHAAHYRRWGFVPIAPRAAPRSVRFNYRMGCAAGLVSWFKRRPPRRLVVLERSGFDWAVALDLREPAATSGSAP